MHQLIFDREAEGIQNLSIRIQERNINADIGAGVRFPEGGIVPDDLINHVGSGNRLEIVFYVQAGAAILLRNEPAKAHLRHAKRFSTGQSSGGETESLLPVHQVDPRKGQADTFQGL